MRRQLRDAAAWADHNLLPVVLVALLFTDSLVGLAWLLQRPEAFSGEVFEAAQDVAPMRAHGALLLISAACAGVAYTIGGRRWATGYFTGALLGGAWLFWAVLFSLAPLAQIGGSLTLTAVSVGLCALHVPVGLAAAHPPRA